MRANNGDATTLERSLSVGKIPSHQPRGGPEEEGKKKRKGGRGGHQVLHKAKVLFFENQEGKDRNTHNMYRGQAQSRKGILVVRGGTGRPEESQAQDLNVFQNGCFGGETPKGRQLSQQGGKGRGGVGIPVSIGGVGTSR